MGDAWIPSLSLGGDSGFLLQAAGIDIFSADADADGGFEEVMRIVEL